MADRASGTVADGSAGQHPAAVEAPPRAATLSVVIPAYNEERTIAELLRRVQAVRLPGVRMEILVVDDHSGDRTCEQVRPFGEAVRLIRHPRNLGKGAAVKTGFRAAVGDVVIIQDADLEYDPQDYPGLIEPILRQEAEVVIGSRFLLQKPRFFTERGDPFFSHYIGNKLIIWLTNLLYGFRATDYEGCYKAFTRSVLRATPVETDGFDFDNELICKLLRKRVRVLEVPIRYTPRPYAAGKKIRWHHGARMVWTILKWRVLPIK